MPWFEAPLNHEMLKNTQVGVLLCFFLTLRCICFSAQYRFSEKRDSHNCKPLSGAKGKVPDAARLVIKIARISNTGKHLSFSPWKGWPAYLQFLASLKPSTTKMKNYRPLAPFVISVWIVAVEKWFKLWPFQAFWNTTASKIQRSSIKHGSWWFCYFSVIS